MLLSGATFGGAITVPVQCDLWGVLSPFPFLAFEYVLYETYGGDEKARQTYT